MANVTLDEEFNSLGGPWHSAYPWSPNGFTAGDLSSWMANPAMLPSDGNPVSTNNGVLTLSNFPKPDDVSSNAIGGLSRIGGQVFTNNSFSQTYGYFEARIQMPAGNGALGAFWLMPESGAWPPELDVAEVIGNAPNTLVNSLHDSGAPSPHWGDGANMTQDFHTYAVDWEPNTITWYLDGQKTFETSTTANMHQPMYVDLTNQSGQPGSWEGSPDSSLVSEMKVDYVRVYDSNPYTSGGAVTATPNATATLTQSSSATPPAPADTAAAAPDTWPATSNNAIIADPGSITLFATQSSDVFQFQGSGHDTIIQNFQPGDDKIDFEMTAQDFSNVSITALRHGGASINFDGNHISLPGVNPDQISQSNFMFDLSQNGA